MFIGNYLDDLSKSLEHLYGSPIVVIVFTAFLLIASYTDVMHLKIPNKLNGMFFLSRFAMIPILGFSLWDVAAGILCFIALLIPAMVKMNKMGGDIKCVTVIGLYTSMGLAPTFLILACFYSALYTGVSYLAGRKVRMFPFAPFFLLSNVTLLIVYYSGYI
ncbi:prepilin peptidase (plasmid) [Paenibacillus thiaminolyticus]|uniref:prepilin peptidase n=1 Tax=Paenibacillus thiaminolyticus TaxID=49283 RepID=UPI00232AE9D6|nr:prepilin peptidase [Paenibacillus thiaminolyticus]WCF11730.1 prepilin peptidase [Paenibacillus thiaminolyticus]